ncbi:DNA primase family protein [Aquisphaera insulae]|uniref:DNA primase family protein n=1 Tax=Aquisphaera insulae TaxID=2712864 RepID=UPI0013EB2FD8|nr:phage/plasmid primase, P4 family [Aquisphaera insulae]
MSHIATSQSLTPSVGTPEILPVPQPEPIRFDAEAVRDHLEWLRRDGEIIELRLLKAWDSYRSGCIEPGKSTLSGYYLSIDAAVRDLSRVAGVNAYALLNPASADAAARGLNKLQSGGHTTADSEILLVRRVLIDVDPRRPAGVSATAEEHAAALAVRDAILAAHPEIAAASRWGSSGNGAWIIAEVGPLGIDEASVALVKRFLAALARRHDTPSAEVDVKTCNPARIAGIPGLPKCKGEDVAFRPHRLATRDDPRGRELAPLDLAAYVAKLEAEEAATVTAVAVAAPRPAAGHTHNAVAMPPPATAPEPDDDVHERARQYLAKMPPAIAGQSGHKRAYTAAVAVVHGFAIDDEDDALEALSDWNQRCQPPWSEAELLHKIRDAATKEHKASRGWLVKAGEKAAAVGGGPQTREADDDPHRLARHFLAERRRHADHCGVVYHRGSVWQWDGSAYREIADHELAASANDSIKCEYDRLCRTDTEAWLARGMKDRKGRDCPPPVVRKVVGSTVTNAVAALRGLTLLRGDVEAPAWLTIDPPFPARDTLATRKHLVHLPAFVAGAPEAVHRATPAYYSPFAVDYDFDSAAPEPTTWLRFLADVWGDDDESIGLLQEWLGYCLTGDTSQQKLLMLVGPPGSGKGTIARMARLLIGPENVVGPTLSGLCDRFGLEPLISKSLAIVGDARLSGRVDGVGVTELLLGLTGEDTTTAHRKGRSSWTGKLPTRIMLLSNELPRLPDQANALMRRLLLLRTTVCFEEPADGKIAARQVDRQLDAKLAAELPGILLWAIAGWRRLRDRGHFVQAAAGKEMVEAIRDLSSPVGAFLRDRCRIAADATVDPDTLFVAWTRWCEASNRHAGTKETFGRDLRAAVPGLTAPRPRGNSQRKRIYQGVGLAGHDYPPV